MKQKIDEGFLVNRNHFEPYQTIYNQLLPCNVCLQNSIQLRTKWTYSHEISQQTIYNMDLILFLKLVRYDALRK